MPWAALSFLGLGDNLASNNRAFCDFRDDNSMNYVGMCILVSALAGCLVHRSAAVAELTLCTHADGGKSGLKPQALSPLYPRLTSEENSVTIDIDMRKRMSYDSKGNT